MCSIFGTRVGEIDQSVCSLSRLVRQAVWMQQRDDGAELSWNAPLLESSGFGTSIQSCLDFFPQGFHIDTPRVHSPARQPRIKRFEGVVHLGPVVLRSVFR